MWKNLLLVLALLVGAFLRLYQITSLPPGGGFDPAWYGLDALEILNGARPIYLATNFGREVLFSYIVTLFFKVVGPGAFGIHLASATIAILTIPAIYLLAKEFFAEDKHPFLRTHGDWLTTFILAISFWHLMWSRYSVRVILIPLLFSLAGFTLLRATRTKSTRYFLATGFLLGIGFYTYQLAQVLPVLISGGFISYLFYKRNGWQYQKWTQVAGMVAIMLLVLLPLATYIINNPGVFNTRLNDALLIGNDASFAELLPTFSQQGGRVVEMYFWLGDNDPAINLPGRPVLNIVLSIAFIAGLFISLANIRQWKYLFLLYWVVLFSLPPVISVGAAMSKRAMGALPAVMLLCAVGILYGIAWIVPRVTAVSTSQRRLTHGLLAAILLFTAVTTYRDYFIKWASDPNLLTHYDVGESLIGEYVYQLPRDTQVYLSPIWGQDASLRLHSRERKDIRDFNGRHCLVFPAETKKNTVFITVPSLENNSLPLLTDYFPTGQVTYDGRLKDKHLFFQVFEVEQGTAAVFEPMVPVNAIFGESIEILGYDIETTQFGAGDEVTLTLYHRTLQGMPQNLIEFVHILGEINPATNNPIWGQQDREPCFKSYPTSRWQTGEIVRDTFNIRLDANTPPGVYTLAIGFYNWPELARLNIADSGDNALTLGEIVVSASDGNG